MVHLRTPALIVLRTSTHSNTQTSLLLLPTIQGISECAASECPPSVTFPTSTKMSMTTYPSTDFVMSAGSVLFRVCPETGARQVCLLRVPSWDYWVLPKGRKDVHEDITKTAVRETYEETGYPCELIACRMPTRATPPGVSVCNATRVVDDAVEPIAITIRHSRSGSVKVIWWYITRATGEKVDGTQMPDEDYESVFVDAKDAVNMLDEESDRDVVEQALKLMKGFKI